MEYIISLFAKPAASNTAKVDSKRSAWIDRLCATRGTEYRARRNYSKSNV